MNPDCFIKNHDRRLMSNQNIYLVRNERFLVVVSQTEEMNPVNHTSTVLQEIHRVGIPDIKEEPCQGCKADAVTDGEKGLREGNLLPGTSVAFRSCFRSFFYFLHLILQASFFIFHSSFFIYQNLTYV